MNLLITGAWQQAAEYIPQIEKKHSVQFLAWEKENLPCDPSWVEGVVGNGFFLSHPIESFTNLRYIQLTSAGFDRVPMDFVADHGIKIFNARGVYSIPMAEYALYSVLALYKKGDIFHENQKQRLWEKERNLKELYGQSVCVLGCGSVGSECAKRFEAMGCTVFGVDPFVKENPHFSQIYHTDDINEALKLADITIITLPLTDKTRHMFNSSLFAAMKNDSVLVNIARGALVDTDALIDALENKLYGAVLDVFEEEPLPESSPLWNLKNVLITPHNSFVGNGNGKRMSNVIMMNLDEYSTPNTKGNA
jgi:phosphoglycerate dehydrogenase-like enzyme